MPGAAQYEQKSVRPSSTLHVLASWQCIIVSTDAMAVVEETFFGAWDYVVLGLVLLTSASIGVYYRLTGGRQKTVEVLISQQTEAPTVPSVFFADFLSTERNRFHSSQAYIRLSPDCEFMRL
ncbi:Protein of unknown function [Gryllus bimaculatus]|nr:Protein of unknown function [Gryllus bimaculatus]